MMWCCYQLLSCSPPFRAGSALVLAHLGSVCDAGQAAAAKLLAASAQEVGQSCLHLMLASRQARLMSAMQFKQLLPSRRQLLPPLCRQQRQHLPLAGRACWRRYWQKMEVIVWAAKVSTAVPGCHSSSEG